MPTDRDGPWQTPSIRRSPCRHVQIWRHRWDKSPESLIKSSGFHPHSPPIEVFVLVVRGQYLPPSPGNTPAARGLLSVCVQDCRPMSAGLAKGLPTSISLLKVARRLPISSSARVAQRVGQRRDGCARRTRPQVVPPWSPVLAHNPSGLLPRPKCTMLKTFLSPRLTPERRGFAD